MQVIRTPRRQGLYHTHTPVDTENPVRIENAGFRSVREIIIVSTMTPFFIALLALVTSTFRAREVWLRSLPSAIRSPSCNKARRVVSAFGNLTGCCGFGCPVAGRPGGTGCASSSQTQSSAGIERRLRGQSALSLSAITLFK